MLALQAVWVGVWAAAAAGVYLHYHNQPADATTPDLHSHHLHTGTTTTSSSSSVSYSNNIPSSVVFLLLLSLYWGIQLVKSVLQCTVSGVVGSWWFQPVCTSAVRGALLRSTTTSFGSLCFGSLLVAIVHTIREMMAAIRNRRRDQRTRNVASDCALCVVDKLLQWLESLLVYFNKYAFCYVAAYGLPFIESGRRVSDLFYKRLVS